MKRKTLIIIGIIALLLVGAYFVTAQISPSLNLNGLGRFAISNYTTVTAQNFTAFDGQYCLNTACDHRVYYNGTATIIE